MHYDDAPAGKGLFYLVLGEVFAGFIKYVVYHLFPKRAVPLGHGFPAIGMWKALFDGSKQFPRLGLVMGQSVPRRRDRMHIMTACK